MTDLDILRQQAATLLQVIENEQHNREIALEAKAEAGEAKRLAIEAKGDFQHASEYCVLGAYAARKGYLMRDPEASEHGRKMSEWCRARGIAIGRVPHEKYVDVASYPKLEMDKYFRTDEFKRIREKHLNR